MLLVARLQPVGINILLFTLAGIVDSYNSLERDSDQIHRRCTRADGRLVSTEHAVRSLQQPNISLCHT